MAENFDAIIEKEAELHGTHVGDDQTSTNSGEDVVKVFNNRGAILAGALIYTSIRPSIIELSTGAWYDPLIPGQPGNLEVHGNPNVLTPDRGTSKLAQGPTTHSTLVQVEKFVGTAPGVTIFKRPPIE